MLDIADHQMFQDDQGASFLICEISGGKRHDMQKSVYPWKSLIALFIVWIAVVFNISFIWGLIFLIWILPDLKYGETFFLDRIERHSHPMLYWSILITWIGLAIWLLFLSM